MAEVVGAVFVLALAWARHGTGGLVLAIAGLSAAWLASRLLWPYKPCPRCRKHPGRNPGSDKRRHGDCQRCKGAGRVRRFGARHVHRAKLAFLNRKDS
jgi:hypothetical protein